MTAIQQAFTDHHHPSLALESYWRVKMPNLSVVANFLPRVFVNCGLGTYLLSFLFSIWSHPRMKQWISSFISDVSAVVKTPLKRQDAFVTKKYGRLVELFCKAKSQHCGEFPVGLNSRRNGLFTINILQYIVMARNKSLKYEKYDGHLAKVHPAAL